jgi:lipopolysaccharide/colanic/teichoic acid biosynthesis glycosyltransferase
VHIDVLRQYILSISQSPSVLDSEVILSDDMSQNLTYRCVKRLIDFGFAVAIIILLWWLLIMVWIFVRIDSKGPGFFAQERVGQYGKTFTCYKFRTMRQGTPQVGTHEISVSSVTGIGRILRRTKIDELPQVWNILRNQMSLIGPRPCLPMQQELIDERHKRGVDVIKPGISGLAQIKNIDMSNPVRLAVEDARYKALRSILLDVRIAILTATGHGQGDKIE